PMTRRLSGLAVEYVIGLVTSSEAGDREATIVFDLGDGTRDLEFRSEVPVLFKVEPARPVRISAVDERGQPTTVRLTIRDAEGRIYPAQSKRLAPDFFFQPQVYRRNGESVLLPDGNYSVEASRGPEYAVQRSTRTVSGDEAEWKFELKRWIDASTCGFYSGDHHIHGAGCSHYTSPTEGVTPADMLRQVQGEGLNVGCVLTWGPCFDFQRRFFSPEADLVSEPFTRLKYDLEISGFGSQALGHICLLNLKDQTYPGTDGSSLNWPTWTVPTLKWAKAQGGVVGYPHSALRTLPKPAAERLLSRLDADHDSLLSPAEVAQSVLPEAWRDIDRDGNERLTLDELTASCDRQLDAIPNLVIPDLGGGGALEICVSTALGACDFISTMDTARIGEWNTWYHLLNCGFPIKAAGETDFPCMSSRAVGQGRTYVQLGNVKQVDFADWCEGLKAGRSYTSDGYGHAVRFQVGGQSPGGSDVALDAPGNVHVQASVAFAEEQPKAVAYGSLPETVRRRNSGDTVVLHGPRSEEMIVGGTRLVELIVNGRVVAGKAVPADGRIHEVQFDIPIEKSSWVALRQFPQLHTNPVNVLVDGRPIRASRESALWCRETVRALWEVRHRFIAESERQAARAAYDEALGRFETIASESR
ncbi:MAG TPA: CehA/McbA family metallohydrolase, partial [Caulifigura sp.]|nr:CehA/McbA family metallohydrolase [Caulifigura sp.]